MAKSVQSRRDPNRRRSRAFDGVTGDEKQRYYSRKNKRSLFVMRTPLPTLRSRLAQAGESNGKIDQTVLRGGDICSFLTSLDFADSRPTAASSSHFKRS